ncbi:MAG: homoserine kinase [Halobacteriaceae archaeon]
MVTVVAPATSANLGSGFDVFGVALDRPVDILSIERAEETTIQLSGYGVDHIPTTPSNNTAGIVANSLDVSATIKIDKGIPPASGLGSSAASAAGAAVGLNMLYDLGYSARELVSIAAQGEAVVAGEPHNDNVAPAIMGGFTIASQETIETIPATMELAICLPELTTSTKTARDELPTTIPLEKHSNTIGNAALVTLGMVYNNSSLVGQGMEETVITPVRASRIEGYDTVVDMAKNAGAYGVTVSGSGPAVIAVCSSDNLSSVCSAMVEGFANHGIESRSFQTSIGSGATVL